jgi:LacI family transcriptional regulator
VIAEATRPPLTSIDMNLRDLGREAGIRMLDMIAGKRLSGVQRLPCTLVIRDSCGGQKA